MADDGEERGEQRIDPADLARLTAEVVSAYVTRNTMAQSDLPQLIGAVSRSLQELGRAPEQAAPARPEPAVSVRRSISPDHITCLVCGKRQKTLKRHLAAAHDLTPGAYRELYGLGSDYPMVAPSYAQQRSEMALRIGLGRKRRSSGRRS